MKSLFLDTSSFFIQIAIVDDNQILFHYQTKNDQKLSEKIFGFLEETFQKAEISPNEIEKIYIVNGPGSFTGARLGVTIAKTMAWDLKIPICSVSSLLVLASGFTYPVKVVIPDRNDFGFCALYNQKLVAEQELYTKIGDFIKKSVQPIVSYVPIKECDVLEPKVDILRIIKKYKNKSEKVHLIKINYLKKLDVEKIACKE